MHRTSVRWPSAEISNTKTVIRKKKRWKKKRNGNQYSDRNRLIDLMWINRSINGRIDRTNQPFCAQLFEFGDPEMKLSAYPSFIQIYWPPFTHGESTVIGKLIDWSVSGIFYIKITTVGGNVCACDSGRKRDTHVSSHVGELYRVWTGNRCQRSACDT